MTEEIARDLPLLETLDAAPGGAIEEGKVEPTGLVLCGRGLLKSAEHLSAEPGNRARTTSEQLLRALLSTARRGDIKREGLNWKITGPGRQKLALAGIDVAADARSAAAKLTNRPLQDLLAEAARTLSAT